MRAVWKRCKYAVILFLTGLAGCNMASTTSEEQSRNPGSVTGGKGQAVSSTGHQDPNGTAASGRGVEGTTGSGTLTGK